MVDQGCRCRVPLAAGKAPRLFHVPGVDADNRADLLPLGGDARIEQLAGASALAHPFRRRPGLPVGICDVDVATEADHGAEAEFGQEGEQLLIAEAAIGEDGHPAARRD